MIAEAAACGLVFKPEIVAEYWDYASETGRIYDSRSALGVFYRYHPRSAAELMGGGTVPLVHSSVIVRMAEGSDGYAPVSLPGRIDILTPSGNRLAFGQLAPGDRGESSISDQQTDQLPLPRSRQRNLAKMEEELAAAIERLKDSGKGDQRERVELMNDTVWWRRGFYYVLLMLAIVAALFPFLADYVHHQPTEQIDLQVRGFVGPLLGLVKGVLPGFAAIWIDAVALHPIFAGVLVLLLGVCLWLNSMLRVRIADRARQAWSVAVRKDGGKLDANRATAHRSSAMFGALLFAAATLVAVLRGAGNAAGFFGVIALGCLAVFGFARQPGYRGRDRGGMTSFLGFARTVRMNRWAFMLYCWLRTWILPGAFLVASIVLILAAANKAAFEIANSMGAFCPEPAAKDAGQPAITKYSFDIGTMCADTGIKVKKGVTYSVDMAVTGARTGRPGWTGAIRPIPTVSPPGHKRAPRPPSCFRLQR